MKLRSTKLLSCVSVLTVMALASCAEMKVRKLEKASPTGSRFSQELAKHYLELSSFEARDMYDEKDGKLFAEKGLQAAAGNEVTPEKVEGSHRRLPAEKVPLLSESRQRLVTTFDKGVKEVSPITSAEAQAKFDCWVEQQEENHQQTHIAQCRERFALLLARLEAQLVASQIFYNVNGHALTQADRDLIMREVIEAKATPNTRLVIDGYADGLGSIPHNKELSERRVRTVGEYAFKAGGLDRGMVIGNAYGRQGKPGERNKANRRVDINVIYE